MKPLIALFFLFSTPCFAQYKFDFMAQNKGKHRSSGKDKDECFRGLAQNVLWFLRLEKKFELSESQTDGRRFFQSPFAAEKVWYYLIDKASRQNTLYSINIRAFGKFKKDADGNVPYLCQLDYGDTYDMAYLFDDHLDKTIVSVEKFGGQMLPRPNRQRGDFRAYWEDADVVKYQVHLPQKLSEILK